jgi:MFS transporter, SP family, galactose:H+ symporter
MNPMNHFYMLISATIAIVAGLLFGFDVGIINGALEFISKTFNIIVADNQFYNVLSFMQISATALKEFIVFSVPAGAMFGAAVGGVITHFLGRRGCITLTAILFIFGTLLAATALNISSLILGRLIIGIAVGLIAMSVPIFLAEIAPIEVRGAIIFLFQMAITLGMFFAFIINYLFHTQEDWRAMFDVGLVPAVILGIGIWLIPESPRWLVLKGRHDKAHKNLCKLRGHSAIEDELTAIKYAAGNAVNGFKILFSKSSSLPIAVTVCIFIFQQLTGINTIFYYAPTLFEAAGIQGNSAEILAVLATYGVNILAALLGIWLIDRFGRRKLLCFGFIGIIIAQIFLGCAYSYLFGTEISWICVIASLVFIACYAVSLSGMAYVIMTELFPLHIRSAGIALVSSIGWGINMLISAYFLHFANSVGFANTYWFYAILTSVGLLFVTMFVPETKHVSLEHIEKNLYAGISSRYLGKIFEDA